MKFVIFSDKSYNYKRPISDGLKNVLCKMGHEVEIYYDGLYWLEDLNLFKVLIEDIYRFFNNLKYKNRHIFQYRFWNLLTFYNKKRQEELKKCDCIIIVSNCPSIFHYNERINYIREKYKKPIVNYDFHFLPNQGWWKYLLKDNTHVGLEKFDWYLPIGLITEFPIPNGFPQIYNCIGMDVTHEDLFPQQKDFVVLLDFPREGHEQTRQKEKAALDEIGVKYIELNGRYTTKEIREIYRKCSAYVISFRESFGLPIVELQLCGAYVLTPHKEWVPAHYRNKSPYERGAGELGSNFFEYKTIDDFKNCVLKLKNEINPNENISKFRNEYPNYYNINKKELNTFISKINTKEITYKTHENFAVFNSLISIEDDYRISDID